MDYYTDQIKCMQYVNANLGVTHGECTTEIDSVHVVQFPYDSAWEGKLIYILSTSFYQLMFISPCPSAIL